MDLSPLPVNGLFLLDFLTPKKKPAIDADAGFPCLLSSQRKVWIFVLGS